MLPPHKSRSRELSLSSVLLAAALPALLACGSSDTSIGSATSGNGGATATSSTSSGMGGASSGTGGMLPTSGWHPLAPLGQGARQENAVAALGGEVFVIGGFSASVAVVPEVEAYDPSADSWRDAPPLPAARHHLNAATVNGKLYVLGGLVGLKFGASGLSWVYDPALDNWSPVAPMPAGTERGGGGVAAIGSKVFIAGGYRGGAVADMSAYDTDTDSWEVLTPLPQARDHLVAGAIAGIFFAIGGREGAIEGIVDRVDAYDPADDSWQNMAPMPTARGGCAAASLDGRIYVFGGEGNTSASNGVFDNVSAYDAARDSWTVLTPMLTPRHGTGAAAVDGVIYVPGGATEQAFGAVDTHEAYVP